MWNTRVFFICAAVVLSLTAQTPAPAPAPARLPANAKPLRHLAYDFQVSYVQNGEAHSSGFNGGGSGGVGAGVGSLLQSSGRKGDIAVDVMALADDGSLLVTVSEEIQYAPRRQQLFTCYVYGDGHTVCPSNDVSITDTEAMLLSYLGRGFIDSTVGDAGGSWQHKYDGKDVSVVTNFTLTNGAAGSPATIVKHSEVTSKVPTVDNSIEDATIRYDRSLSVPDDIHDVVKETHHATTLTSTVDFQLTADSFKHS